VNLLRHAVSVVRRPHRVRHRRLNAAPNAARFCDVSEVPVQWIPAGDPFWRP
jgi:hypothetical protein